MNFEKQLKETGKATIEGREVTFTYEHLEGENPKTIEVKAQTIKEGKTETIQVSYDVVTGNFSKCQCFHVPNGELTPVIAAIETEITGIVESFNTTH